MPQIDYLKKILTARVYDVTSETALEFAPQLSHKCHNAIYLKREDTHAVFSYKIRGAYNRMAQLTPAQLKQGVITASAGNHAQGVAFSAAKLKCKATIVVPETTPTIKIEAIKRFGGEFVNIVLHGGSYTDAYDHALKLEKKLKLTFAHPFDDPDVIAGQGTMGMEILRQHPDPIEAIFVPIGGGGAIAGIAAYVKAVRPDIKIIGVQSVDSDAMAQSVAAGKRVLLKDVGIFADGTAVKLVGKETFRLVQQYVDGFVSVTVDDISTAIKDVFQDTRSILEPSGAMAIAGLKIYAEQHKLKGKNLIAIASGANTNFDRLRYIADRADAGQAREALFAVTIPEERGSFKRLCDMVGEQRTVTEFNYRMNDGNDGKQAHLMVGIAVTNNDESLKIADKFNKKGFATVDLSNNELAKQHVRNMIGGACAAATDELIYRFEFPERSGVLMNFLTSVSPHWNISLFQYRHQGGDFGSILVGIQVPKTAHKTFKTFLPTLGYRYWDETANPVYQLFLK